MKKRHLVNAGKTNPIQTQSNPIKANKMPKQTQFKPKTNPIKPNFKRYLAKMGHHELKYIDRLGQLSLNLKKSERT